ncbi:MAG: leucine-rich repeat domain-containing protein [Ruminococcus sp.]|nr:leucine-rich repeat domain-containing protein [Ruminococcus sp.]
MFRYKKTAALIMSLLICASVPAYSAFADNETETVSEAEVPTEASTEEATEAPAETEIKVSGDFSYSVTEEGTACIEGCTSSEDDLVIPDKIDGYTVAEIGQTAFGNDKQLYKTISIPATVEYISGNGPFSVCPVLTEIKVDSANENYISVDGVLYSKDKTELICYPSAKTGTSYAIPEGVKKIGYSSFYVTELSEITFPSTLEEMGAFAVGSNRRLTKVDISNTKLTEIPDYAFAYCNTLSEVIFPETLLSINGAAFAGCVALSEIELPEKLSSIAQYAFFKTGLKKIEIPSSITEIGYCALGYTSNTAGEEIMNKDFIIVGEYGSAAHRYAYDTDSEYDYANNFTFRTYELQEDLDLLEGLTFETCGDYQYAKIEGGAAIVFCSSEESVITVPAELDGVKITEIYPAAFSACTASEIIVSEGIKTIKKTAFDSCPNLKSITLPQSVETIEDYVFENCLYLEKIDLGGAVTIGGGVFNSCSALKELIISGNCKNIGIEGENPYMHMTSLEKITVTDGGDGNYSSKDGILYNKDKSVLVHYPKGKTAKKYTVPDGVKEIFHDAFYGNTVLEEVDLSDVEVIGISGFEHCDNLSSVKLSKKLKRIEGGAFYDCTNLKEIRLRSSDTEIHEFAFGYYYDSAKTNEDGSTGGNSIVDGFKLYTKKAKNDTGVEYAEANGIEAVTNTVDIFGKNIRKEILWIFGGGLGLLIAALAGSLIIKKSKNKKASTPSKKKKKEEENVTIVDEENNIESDEKETENNDEKA